MISFWLAEYYIIEIGPTRPGGAGVVKLMNSDYQFLLIDHGIENSVFQWYQIMSIWNGTISNLKTHDPSPFDAYIVVLVLYYYLFWQQLSQILKKGKGFVLFHFLFNWADGLWKVNSIAFGRTVSSSASC